jgi:hypothetical protein
VTRFGFVVGIALVTAIALCVISAMVIGVIWLAGVAL